MENTPHLTNPYPGDLSARMGATVNGQATWADLSSKERCMNCRWFALDRNKRVPHKSACGKVKEMTGKLTAPRFSREARACPHFIKREGKFELVKAR